MIKKIFLCILLSAPFLYSQQLNDMRAVHMGGNWGANVNGTQNQPPEYINFLNKINANWVGISIAIHIDDSMDSTVERKYSNVTIPTFKDEVLVRTIDKLRQKGFNVYLTLAFETSDAEHAVHPVKRWQLGDPNMHNEDPNVSAEYWPWALNHPDHSNFVKSFWNSYTEVAVHFARMADSIGVTLFSLGTETERLFRTRSGGYWPNDYKNEISAMVDSVRKVYSGNLTYDMAYNALTEGGFYCPGSDHLWEDLNLDAVGISAYFKLTDTMPADVMNVIALEQKWDDIFNNYILPLQNNNPGLPIIFLEFGYVNSVESPFMAKYNEFNQIVQQDNNQNGVEDGEETQANIYEAFFNTNEKYNRIVKGAFLWGNEMASDNEWENVWMKMRHFGIRERKAEEVVKAYYSVLSKIDDTEKELPENLFLYQNFPNPFNPVTKIKFKIAEPGRVILTVFDLLGRNKEILADKYYQPGVHEILFDAAGLPSGMYLYKITVNNLTEVRKMMVLK